jgi:gliding motility-associated-like protein
MVGGTSPFSYSWSHGAFTEDLSGLSSGTYTLITTDQNGCKDTAAISLTQPSQISISLEGHDVLCHGGSDGYILSTVSGGTMPYSYSWSNLWQSANLPNLIAGTYVLTVVDYNGCVKKDTAEVMQPAQLTIGLNSPEPVAGYNISSYLGNDGSIDLTVNGGTQPYAYLWSNAAVTQDLSGLTAGTYSVVVTDNNNCTATASILLDQPVDLEMPTAFSPNSDGYNDSFLVHGAEAYPDNLLTIFNRWGNVVYQKQGYTTQWAGFNNKGEELPDGTYFAILEVKSKDLVLKGYVEMKR